jgi:hypothetical protein
MNGNSNNALHDVGVEVLWSIVRAHEQKLDHWKKRFDRMEQTIMDLAHLMGNAKSDREEKNLHGDLSQGRQNPRSISQFDEISFYNRRFLKKNFFK